MNAILTIDLAAATLPVLRAALQADGAYFGVARYNVGDMRAYAAGVAACRLAGYVGDITAASIAGIRADLAAKAAEAERAAAVASAVTAELVYQLAPFTTCARPVAKSATATYARFGKAERAALTAQLGADTIWINEQDRFVGFFREADGTFTARDIETGFVAATGLAREKARNACRGIGR